MSNVSLNNWRWRLARAAGDCPFPASIYEWHDCKHKNTTTEIFTDLFDAEYIPDPHLDLNEHDERIQWVKEGDWVYSAVFTKQESEAVEGSQDEQTVDLILEGLDTFATVKVNDTVVLRSENMFHQHRVNIREHVKVSLNTVEITFHSAWKKGLELESKIGKLKACNGHSSRTQVRKAAYHYGWDWGPALMTCGPWREVRVESYIARICNPFARFEFMNAESGDSESESGLALGLKNLAHATLTVKWEGTDSANPIVLQGHLRLRIRVFDPDRVLLATELLPTASFSAQESPQQIMFGIQGPQLWWPHGLGDQPLYEVKMDFVDPKDDPVDASEVSLFVGARTAQLQREPLPEQEGETFYFMINNQPVCISGSNMIPLHSFATKVMPEDYQSVIDHCLEGNQNMIRVWGGGIYEHDDFYSQCDDRGVLVWQDFMFACAQYPWYDDFEKNVEKEARDQLYRLRNYCSIIIFAGNNEDHQVIEAFGLEKSFWARDLYEKVLPNLVSELVPNMPYWPGSPWSGKDSTDPLVGDIHQWDVWHGTQEPYQLWSKLTGRFVSEFGMLSYPSGTCVNAFITDPEQRYPQSAAMEDHMKSEGGVRRLALYILENLRMDSTKMEDWIYASQLIQAECMSSAIRSCRRQWRGPGKFYCGGQIVWQLNDVYPAASWSIVDFCGRRKLAWYAIKRESAPVTIGVERTTPEMANLTCGLRNKQDANAPGNTTLSLRGSSYSCAVWISTTAPVPEGVLRLQISLYDIRSGDCIQKYDETHHMLLPNTCLEVRDKIDIGDQTLLVATLRRGQDIIARAFDWPQPLKYVKFHPQCRISITREGECITVRSPQAVKGLELYVPGLEAGDIQWSDNGFDLAPREAYEVRGKGLLPNMDLKVQFYGSD